MHLTRPLPFLPSDQQEGENSTCASHTSFLNLCTPLKGSSFFPMTQAPLNGYPLVEARGYPITTAFIFMTQQAVGELGLSLSPHLSHTRAHTHTHAKWENYNQPISIMKSLLTRPPGRE